MMIIISKTNNNNNNKSEIENNNCDRTTGIFRVFFFLFTLLLTYQMHKYIKLQSF